MLYEIEIKNIDDNYSIEYNGESIFDAIIEYQRLIVDGDEIVGKKLIAYEFNNDEKLVKGHQNMHLKSFKKRVLMFEYMKLDEEYIDLFLKEKEEKGR